MCIRDRCYGEGSSGYSPLACVATCSIAGDDCVNPNSVCTATGVIGDLATLFTCLPKGTFLDAGSCPTGTQPVEQADGNYQCIAPSAIACIGSSDLSACSYDWGGYSVNGNCFWDACVASCSMAGDDCFNPNSVCYATGAIGAPTTGYVCIPENTFPGPSSCPSGTLSLIHISEPTRPY